MGTRRPTASIPSPHVRPWRGGDHGRDRGSALRRLPIWQELLGQGQVTPPNRVWLVPGEGGAESVGFGGWNSGPGCRAQRTFLKDVHCQLGTEGRTRLCIGMVPQTKGPMFRSGGVYAPGGMGWGWVERHIWRNRCAHSPTSISSSNRQTADLCLADKILCRDNTFLKCGL